MSDVTVKVTLDKAKTIARLKNASKKSIHIVSQQALKDCNYYCKQDQGTLIASSLTHSQLEKGLLKWSTPYARKQYYLKSTSHSVNNNAEWMWAEKAHSVHGKEWKKTFQEAIKKEAKPK